MYNKKNRNDEGKIPRRVGDPTGQIIVHFAQITSLRMTGECCA